MQPPLAWSTVPRGHEDLLHLVSSELSRKPESQALHSKAPLLVHSEPDFGLPLSHLHEFCKHFVLPELSRNPELQSWHMEAPLEVHSEPALGVPFPHLQLFCKHFVLRS